MSDLRILVVATAPADYEQLRRELAVLPLYRSQTTWAPTLDAARATLDEQAFDVIIVGNASTACEQGLALSAGLPPRNCFTPVIQVAACGESGQAEEFRIGAVEFLEKGRCTGAVLERAIRAALERKSTERALWSTRQRYDALIQSLSQIVWRTDAAGTVIDQAGWEGVTGQSMADLQADGWLKVIPPEDHADLMARWRASLGTGAPYDHTTRVRTATGEVHWFRMRGVPIRDGTGAITEWVGIATDIDAERRADATLRQSNARRQAIIEAQAAIAAAGMNLVAIKQYASQSVLDMLGADLAGMAQPDGFEWRYDFLAAGTMEHVDVGVHRGASLTGWCADHRESIRCDDLHRDIRASALGGTLGGRSGLYVPLIAEDKVQGVLCALSRRVAAFDDEDLRALELLAGTLGPVIANARADEERRVLLAERTAALEQLRRSEELFRALTEHSVELINILDAEGRIRYTSPSVTKVLGWTPNDLQGHRPSEFVHPDDLTTMRDALGHLLAAPGTVHPMTVRMRHKSGSWHYMEGRGHNLLHVPAIGGITTNARDVTARVEAMREIEFQARLLGTVQQGVIATDADNRITYWSDYSTQMYGWRADEAIGRRLRDLVVPPQSLPMMRRLTARLRAGESWTGEAELMRRDGTQFIALVTATPILDRDGRVTGSVGVAQDITERRALEHQLRQSQKMEAVGQLAGGVAHDFNNILTAITSYSELLLEDVRDEAHRRDLLEIRRAADRAADLTKRLLTFSRRQPIAVEVLDAAAAVRGFERLLARVALEDIALSIDCDSDPVLVRADRTQLEQVVLNLVVNARDALPDGGRIDVSMRAVNGRAILRVRDNGSGMSAETRDRIFEPFFTTKQPGKGTGLGLSIVYSIVKQFEGTIAVTTAVGQGTEFTIDLPLAPTADVSVSERPPEPLLGGGTETILLVEDEPALLALSARVLRQQGYQVHTARDGADALAVLGSGVAPHAIVSDVVMPEMSGLELLRELERQDRTVPILFTSGYAKQEMPKLTELRSPMSFLCKPWTPHDLGRAVRTLLDNPPAGPFTDTEEFAVVS